MLIFIFNAFSCCHSSSAYYLGKHFKCTGGWNSKECSYNGICINEKCVCDPGYVTSDFTKPVQCDYDTRIRQRDNGKDRNNHNNRNDHNDNIDYIIDELKKLEKTAKSKKPEKTIESKKRNYPTTNADNKNTDRSHDTADTMLTVFTMWFAIIFAAAVIIYTIAVIYTFAILVILLMWSIGYISNEKMIKIVKIYVAIYVVLQILQYFSLL